MQQLINRIDLTQLVLRQTKLGSDLQRSPLPVCQFQTKIVSATPSMRDERLQILTFLFLTTPLNNVRSMLSECE